MNFLFRVGLLWFFFNSTLLVSGNAQNPYSYHRIYLSGKDAATAVNWEFRVSEGRNAGTWSQIPVPSNWEMHGFGTFNYGHDHRDKSKVLGKEIGEYKTSFFAPREWKGKVIRLVFDGVMTDTEVRVNGKIVGAIHQGGFYRFGYEIDSYLNLGKENTLEVKVYKRSDNESVNKAEREADFWIFGGIFRPVFLEVLPENHFTRIALDPKGTGDFKALVTLNDVPKDSKIELELIDPKTGKSIDKISQEVDSDSIWMTHHFSNIKTWNPESPNLYDAIFRLIEEGEITYEKIERFGFRTVELRPKDGIYINDTKVVFKGVNRHSFYPSTGRALSEQNHLEDIALMKAMNMNAVRMSHYPPDERFLELTDSLGLFVLDEVTGWQDAYDTEVGPKLVLETILKDANHPSVVIWDHGNEGGWNFENEKGFHEYDIQDRPIIYPWLLRNNIDTFYYPTYNTKEGRLDKSGEIFMPTEFLHGLYDGGHGAGLKDFWNKYSKSPLHAGGFLWVFSDEAVLRDDLGGKLDTDGNHAPDGILGPFREKEGSFYTIRSVWSPIQLADFDPKEAFDGKVLLSNHYLFSDLETAFLEVEVLKIKGWEGTNVLSSKMISLPFIKPGQSEMIDLELPDNWKSGDILKIKAFGINGKEVNEWALSIHEPLEGNKSYFDQSGIEVYPIKVRESVSDLQIEVDGRIYFFGKSNGTLEMVKVNRKFFYLSQNPTIEGVESKVKNVSWKKLKDGSIQVKAFYEAYPTEVTWTVLPTSELKFEAMAPTSPVDSQLLGLGFSYPESKIKSANFIGNGPYRVWGNRMEGVGFGLWQKEFNNTQTGYSFDSLVYPEFKGFYSDFHALQIFTEDGEIDIRSNTPNLFLSLFKPQYPDDSTPGIKPVQTVSDIAFLYKIPAIGTKFHTAEEMTPAITSDPKAQYEKLELWFRFR